jgi:hypothetical protein
VIKNEKQYRITKAQVRRFEEALTELAGQERRAKITPLLWAAQRDAAASQLHDLRTKSRPTNAFIPGKARVDAGRG